MSAPLPSEPRLKISEIFESVQGEGPSTGKDSIFLRLGGCNLRCDWCDTKYSWDWEHYRIEDELEVLSVSKICSMLARYSTKNLVVTGGEPMIHQRLLVRLLQRLDKEWSVEVETNATIAPSEDMLQHVTQWNVSPKLSHSGESTERREKADVLRTFARLPHAWLKLVVEEDSLDEAKAFIARYGWPKERTLLMPQARNRVELRQRLPTVQDMAHTLRVKTSTRLHLERWNGERGR